MKFRESVTPIHPNLLPILYSKLSLLASTYHINITMADDDDSKSDAEEIREEPSSDEELKPREKNDGDDAKASGAEPAMEEKKDEAPSPTEQDKSDGDADGYDDGEEEESVAADDTAKPPALKGEEKHDSISDDVKSKTPNKAKTALKGEEKHDSISDDVKESEPKKSKTPNKAKTASTDEEEEEDDDEIIECPKIGDILVGRGAQLRRHPGNARMVAIIAVHRLRYTDASDEEKVKIIAEMTSEVQRGGTRFLKVNDNGTGWTRCSKDEIKSKGMRKRDCLDVMFLLRIASLMP